MNGRIATLVPAPPGKWAIRTEIAFVAGRARAFPTGANARAERVELFAIVETDGRHGMEQHIEPVLCDERMVQRPASEIHDFAALIEADSAEAALALFDPTTCVLPSPAIVTAYNPAERDLLCAACHVRRRFPVGEMWIGKEDALAICSDCADEINEAELARR